MFGTLKVLGNGNGTFGTFDMADISDTSRFYGFFGFWGAIARSVCGERSFFDSVVSFASAISGGSDPSSGWGEWRSGT
jgi:hypothetical protein